LAYKKTYIISPLFFFPFLWQRIYFDQTFPDRFATGGHGIFSHHYFKRNLSQLIEGIFHYGEDYPFNTVILMLSLFILIAICIQFYRKKIDLTYELKFVYLLTLLIVFSHLLMMLFFVDGRFGELTTQRLYLLFSFFCSFVCIAGIYYLKKVSPLIFITFSFVNFVLFYPIATRGTYHLYQFVKRKREMVMDHFENHIPLHGLVPLHQILLISSGHVVDYSIENINVLSIKYANKNLSKIRYWMEDKLIREIYLVQEYFIGSNLLLHGQELKWISNFYYETVAERQFNKDKFIRITRLVKRFPWKNWGEII